MVRINGKLFWLFWPARTDVCVGRKAAERVEAVGHVIGHEAGREMVLQRLLGRLVILLHADRLERPVHALHRAVGPRMIDLGAPVLEARLRAHAVDELTEGVLIPLARRALPAVVVQSRMARVGSSGQQVAPARRGAHGGGGLGPLGGGARAGAVDGDAQASLAFCRAHRSQVHRQRASGRAGTVAWQVGRLRDLASG
jgi:hypothetical protein